MTAIQARRAHPLRARPPCAQHGVLEAPPAPPCHHTHHPHGRPRPQIASLKRIGRGSRVLLLDRSGGSAKAVAKELARRGFGRAFVIDGGFDGRGGYVASKARARARPPPPPAAARAAPCVRAAPPAVPAPAP